MNEESSQMQIRQKFDSYCKKVINNAAMDGHQTFGRIQKNECSLDEISLEDIEIAERKHLSGRVVNRKGNKAFCLLKDLLGDESL